MKDATMKDMRIKDMTIKEYVIMKKDMVMEKTNNRREIHERF